MVTRTTILCGKNAEPPASLDSGRLTGASCFAMEELRGAQRRLTLPGAAEPPSNPYPPLRYGYD
jgi:hypothetical protein